MRKNKILALIFTFLLIFSNAAPGFIYAAESALGGEPSIISGEMLEHADEIVDDVDITQSTQTESDTLDVDETVDSDLGEDGDSSTEQLDPENQDPEIAPPAGEQEEIEKEDEIGDAMENIPEVENISPEVANIELFDTNPSDIQLTAEISEAGQTVKINKYFSNSYTVDRGDGSSIVTLTADTTHTYTTAGEYQITLSLAGTASRWTFGNVNKPLVPKAETTASNIYLSSMPSLADYFGANATNPGNYFFSNFNRQGTLTSLPENSFNTSNIITVGDYFFAGFNNNGALTSLPVGSFDTLNITTVGNSFFAGFNFYGGLTSLPENSFNTSNITTVGNYFFQNFNGNGVLTSLPENSFDTSNITTVGDYFFFYFNSYGALTSLPAGSFDTSKITTVGNEFFGAFNTYGALISIPENSFDTSNITTVGDDFFAGFNFYGGLTSLPENSFDTSNITTVGDDFFSSFNSNGALTSLPEGSFDTSKITTAGNRFFSSFNYNGALTSLPEGSFDTSKITTVENSFFSNFNQNGKLTSLPESSFDTSNITTVGNSFFYAFNNFGALTALPAGSFDTSNITTVGNQFFHSFNHFGALTILPENSFNTSNITTAGYRFFSSFNSYGALTSLPKKSFDTSNITSVGDGSFGYFNSNGALTSLPEGSFNTSNITTVGNDFFYSFNGNGALIKANTGIAIKNPTKSSIIFHYQNEGGMSSDSIPANSNFEYYSTTPLDLNLANFPSNIQITAEITESGQTVTINKYFKNIYTINWGDGVGNFSYKDITHSYSTPGTYTITLALTQENERWQFGGNLYTLVPKNGTTAANIYLSSIPSLAEYFGESAEEPGDNFFRNFNSNGALTSIPENSFNTSNITTVGNYFFQNFNYNGALTSLPAGSFNTSKITTVENGFFSSFNSYGALTSLPAGSFNTSKIITVGDYFFSYFNLYGALTSLPKNSFNISNITTVGNNFFSYFNLNGALTSLPGGSFDTSNIITVGDYFFSYFNNNGALTSLPENSFDTSNIKIVGNYFFDNFNGGGKLTKSKNGVAIQNITDSPITFHYRDGDYGYNNTDNVQKNESATYSTVALTPADFPSNIQLIAEITQANQTVTIGKTFRNIHTIDWGDGSWDLNGVQHPHSVTHSYSTPGTYTITVALTEGDERWQFSSYGGQALVPKNQTTAANVYLSSMPSLAEYFGESAENPGDNFFQFFNYNGALTSLPAGSFDTSKITTVGNYFFQNFNSYGALTSLPEGSFNTSNITTVGTDFFLAFNNGGELIKANTGIAIYNPSLNDVTFHYKNPDGSVGSGTIAAGSSFEYYPMMTSYTISFKDTDGSLVASKKVAEGTTVIAPADPERESYTFIGWYSDAELTTEYNFATPVTTDLTLYAKWEKIATTPSENNTTSSSGGGGGFGTNSKSENSTSTHTSAPEGPSFPKTEIDTTSILQNLLKEQLEKEVSTPMYLEKLAQVVASAQQAPVSQELKDAYIYAYLKGITTMDTVESAELDRGLTRAELAKMMVVVAQNLGKEKKVDTSVSYADTASVTGDLADYIQQAYQMQIMGIDAEGNPLENFDPHGEVSRAEFATVLSRVLFGDQYNQGTEDYYSKHLEVLKNKGILQQDNPHIKELRGWVMLMLMRAEQLQN